MSDIEKGEIRSWAFENPTAQFRIRKGKPGELIPENFGFEQAWRVSNGVGVQLEWRPVTVVPHDASDRDEY